VNGGTIDLSGDRNSKSSCTDSSFYGCSRSSNGANIINPIQSAAIKTINSFAFKYGVVEVRAKLPKGDWIWPAIWMLPKNEAFGGSVLFPFFSPFHFSETVNASRIYFFFCSLMQMACKR
jgi:hypothetical protein